MPRAGPVFLSHRSSLDHDTGQHPEQAARIVAIERELERRDWLGFERVESPAVDREVLERAHPGSYVDGIARLAARGGGHLDLDTVISTGSYEAALHSAGGAVAAATMLLEGAASHAFSVHRPPGHHATRTRSMGFCLFSNVAIAALHALDALGCKRVMIVDWDVHHGNGTSELLYEDPRVLFVSIHQWPLYPGTGAASELGSGDGVGFNVNLPVPPRSGDDVFTSLVADVAVPLLRSFSPQLVLVSAGYDAHDDDPLADCAVTEDGYATMAWALRSVCAELGVPVGFVLEGGYALGALARSVAATMAALVSDPDDSRSTGQGRNGPVSLALQARERLAAYWPELA
jgi:acetoin utilization deacetylase AcuC-like enzyme